MGNTNLHKAKNAKNDEFYTRFDDINNELNNYCSQFNGKIVYCNCDDAKESNFFQFFVKRFNAFGIKKLITTGYKENGKGVVYIYEGDKNGNNKLDDSEIKTTELKGNGDFRSEECIEFLKEADIVVTNPPFSLFREYVTQLMDFNKKFIIIGNKNAVTDKIIFPYLQNKSLWLGILTPNEFILPNGEVTKKVQGLCRWYTNLDTNKKRAATKLGISIKDGKFDKYDNFDAINIDNVDNIPNDYNGIMGVPIGITDKLDSDGYIHYVIPNGNDYIDAKYEILWQLCGNTRQNAPKELLEELKYTPSKEDRGGCGLVNGKRKYTRILIRRVLA